MPLFPALALIATLAKAVARTKLINNLEKVDFMQCCS
jgi:hypothetical protein